jgi:hypothetical protein
LSEDFSTGTRAGTGGQHIIVVDRCEGFEMPTGPKGEKRPGDAIGNAA